MNLSQILLPEFEQEVLSARKTLERVPEDKLDWRPHAKSMTMARLASHVAEIPGWAAETVNRTELDLAPPGQPPYQPPVITSRAQILDIFDKNLGPAREAIGGVTDEELMKPWSLLMGGKTLMTLPRIVVLRNFVLSHLVHHRAQLGVYLRLNDIPVPSVYGPSADENTMG